MYVPAAAISNYETPSTTLWYLDLNGDGLEDLAYCAGEGEYVSYWLRGVEDEILPKIDPSPTASFAAYPPYPGFMNGEEPTGRFNVPCRARRSIVTDVNGDGAMDLLFARREIQDDFESHWIDNDNIENTFVAYSYYKQDGFETGLSAYPESDNYLRTGGDGEVEVNDWWLLNNVFRVLDYNGDGLQDIMVMHIPSLMDPDCRDSDGCPDKWFIDVWLSKGVDLNQANEGKAYEKIRINSTATQNSALSVHTVNQLAPDPSLYVDGLDWTESHYRHLRDAFLHAIVTDYNGDGRTDLLMPKVEHQTCGDHLRNYKEWDYVSGPSVFLYGGYFNQRSKFYSHCSYQPMVGSEPDGVIGQWVVWMSTENLGFVQHETGIPYQGYVKYPGEGDAHMYTRSRTQQPLLLDLEGEGVPTLLLQRYNLSTGTGFHYEGETHLHKFNRQTRHLIKKVYHGSLGIESSNPNYDDLATYEIEYKSMADPTVYVPEDSLIQSRHKNANTPQSTKWCDYPVKCVRSRRAVVSKLQTDRGPYAQKTLSTFKYWVQRIDQLRDNMLGFVFTQRYDHHANQVTNVVYEHAADWEPSSNTLSNTLYDEVWYRQPFAGLPKQEIQYVGLANGESREIDRSYTYQIKQIFDPPCFYNGTDCPSNVAYIDGNPYYLLTGA